MHVYNTDVTDAYDIDGISAVLLDTCALDLTVVLTVLCFFLQIQYSISYFAFFITFFAQLISLLNDYFLELVFLY